jgi:hypothetical protein
MGTRITARDLELLGFIAEHRLVLPGHIQALLTTSSEAASARLRSLASAGYLRQEAIFHRQPSCYQITRKGLATIGSGYGPPRLDLRCYSHDVGIAWLWLAARRGTFGPLREQVSERRLRSLDARPDRSGGPAGVRLGGFGPAGKPRLHYPDVLLVLEGGQRVAVELELTAKGRARRDKILSGYAVDSRIDAVLYLVDDAATARAIKASARSIGIPDMVHVQWVRWPQARSGGRGELVAARTGARGEPIAARAGAHGEPVAARAGAHGEPAAARRRTHPASDAGR